MRASELLIPTLRETPAEAEVISHQLMLRAGLIRKAAAGIYTYLPLGYRVIKKIMNIIREEMDQAGGQEIMLPIIQPAELWLETGRWAIYGEEMFRLKDRHGRDFCLGPTHEEIVTALVRSEVSSYRQLPLLLYQIQNKYRDEKRPRFGLMRGREFIMKDLYSFDRDEEGMQASYDKMFAAYSNIFRRCGLKFRAVLADTGAIGGNKSHEFMVLAEAGEAEVVYCEQCEYAANVEEAVCFPDPRTSDITVPEKELVFTPGMRSIEEVSKFLNIDPGQTIKTLFYLADARLVCILLRGDRQANEIKLRNFTGASELILAPEEEVTRQLALPVGYLGPVGLTNVDIFVDQEITFMSSAVTGANRDGYHWTNIVPARDFSWGAVGDLRMVEQGEPCPLCRSPLELVRGIEVGQVFQLGTKYSKTLGTGYLDENGQEKHAVMGCYGIGVSRTMAASIEQNNDGHGIIWPVAIAPAHAVVVPVSNKNPRQMELAGEIYRALLEAGIEVIYDDRDERAGVKFNDADLIGYPLRITVGNRTVDAGTVDVKIRASGEERTIPIEGVAGAVFQMLEEMV
ncbi:MAG: proline--tRNA ligase [Bacillota bacterium]